MAASKKLRLCKILGYYRGNPARKKLILERFNHGEELDRKLFLRALDSYSDVLEHNATKSEMLIQILKANFTLKEFNKWIYDEIQSGRGGGRLQRGCTRHCCTEKFLRYKFGCPE